MIDITYAEIQKRIRRRKIRFRIFLIIIVISIALLYLFTHPVIKVVKITVSGNNCVSKDKIIELSQIKIGDNLLDLNTRKIKQNIYSNPYIEECKVKRSIFGEVFILVNERQNAGVTLYNNKYITFDKNGVVIEILNDKEGINLPFISGLMIKNAQIGKTMDVEDYRQLEAIKIIFDTVKDVNFSDIINEVDVKNLLSIIIKTSYDINIKIGTIDNLDKKLSVAKGIIEQDLKKRELKGTLDVSFNGNPVFRIQ